MNDCQYCEPDNEKCPGRGLCHCGCGGTPTPHRTKITARGIAIGDPHKYLAGHHLSKPYLKTPPMSMAEIKALGG